MSSGPKSPVQPTQSIGVELGERESEGIYSNLALISHTPSEFILDFARLLPGARKAKVHARIVMTPQHAKALRAAIDQNIGRFEEQFGVIPMPSGEVAPRHIGFTTPPPASQQEPSGRIRARRA
jgi:hypothetical protein